MKEKPKRLAPTIKVLRELYLKSGNQCAFPDCNHSIIDENGTLVAELCHIEAALPGAPRFNPEQTNEERRAYENLLLLCHPHHKITDDVEKFPVERMREIKTAHEAKFMNVVGKIQQSVVDYTRLETLRPSKTLDKISRVLGWNLTQEELKGTNEELLNFGKRLNRIPAAARQLLTIMAERAHSIMIGIEDIPILEVESVCRFNREYLSGQYEILERYDFISEIDLDEYRRPHTTLLDLRIGWPIWKDLRTFCDKTGISLHEIVVDLRFDLLD
ncbi:MAG: hypothetical protein H8D43_03350 [Chloroflexi bacterium]|nr:hypothetical protein [Chloroflexota bacterium]